MASPTKLREMAADADAMADRLAAQTKLLRAQAAEFRRLAAAGDEGLRAIYPQDTVGMKRMEARETSVKPSAAAKKAWARIRDAQPFQVALYRRGLSLPEWARAQKRPSITVETAKSWLKKPGKGGNRIPQEWAERIAAEFVDETGASEVPAVDATWPCGIRPARASH